MKNHLKYLKYFLGISLLAFIVVVACDESNLDLRPIHPTEKDYFSDEDAMERLVYAAYTKQTYVYWRNANNPIYPVWLLPADDMTTYGTWDYESFNGLSPTDGLISDYYSQCYGVVTRANILLDKIVEVEEVYETPGLADIHRGEGLFLRALYHFRLANMFSNIPLVLQRFEKIGETKLPPSTYMEIIDQCIADLEEAVSLLPDSWEPKFLGRATKSSAYGLLGKIYCFRACYGSNASADYASAISAFGNISSSVQLTDDFGENFDTWAENNEESLFEFQASNRNGFENIWLWNDFQNIGSMHAYWGFFNDDNQFYAHTPILPTTKLINAYEAGDPRVNEVFQTTTRASYQPHGYEFIKYTKRHKYGDFSSSLNNPRILRLADCLLLEAEARLQTGNIAEATNLVNRIRARARQSVPDTVPVSTVPADLATVTMQNIMNERMLELCGEEGHRWFDLKRWDAAGYIDLSGWGAGDNHFSSIRTDFDFDYPTNLVYPIPLSEMDYNDKMVQNPGY